jgi:hypothetical protein
MKTIMSFDERSREEHPHKEILACAEVVAYGKSKLIFNPRTFKFYTGSVVEKYMRNGEPLVELKFPLSDEDRNSHALPDNYDEIVKAFHAQKQQKFDIELPEEKEEEKPKEEKAERKVSKRLTLKKKSK